MNYFFNPLVMFCETLLSYFLYQFCKSFSLNRLYLRKSIFHRLSRLPTFWAREPNLTKLRSSPLRQTHVIFQIRNNRTKTVTLKWIKVVNKPNVNRECFSATRILSYLSWCVGIGTLLLFRIIDRWLMGSQRQSIITNKKVD